MAITTKARAKGLLRDARALLADKTLPTAVSDALEAVEVALKKNWADLAAEVDAETTPESEAKPKPDTDAVSEAAARLLEARNVGQWFEAQIHQSFTAIADNQFGDGRLTREERIALSSCIGDALDAFARKLALVAPELYKRDPFREPVAVGEAGSVEVKGEIVPLIERAVGKDGTVPIKMIQAGWGTSGYYSKELLQRDGPVAFPAGTQMFWNHATPTEEAERPEGNLAHLAAVTVATPTWQESGPAGPGLYSKAKVFGPYAQALDELAPHIGVSIRGHGIVRAGEADGRKGLIVEKLLPGRSVDFVTTPGAGGQVLSLFEAARSGVRGQESGVRRQEAGMNEQEIKDLQEAKAASDAEVARLREALLLREARDLTAAELAKIEMPEMTRTRLVEMLAARPVIVEGKLDVDAFKARIAEAAKDELTYLAGVTGAGKITGMGTSSGGAVSGPADVNKLAAAMQKLGLNEAAAQAAAQGR
jgi:Sec-independent protein translocase protein TatA